MKLKVVTVITDYSKMMSNWVNTANKLGYDYKILGYGEKWGGWSWRTKKYVEYIKTLEDNTIVVVLDGNDIFFVEKSEEMLKRFLETKKELIVGGEVSCCTGEWCLQLSDINTYQKRNYAINEIKKIRDKLGGTRWMFPNGGFMIGYKKEVLRLLNDAVDAPDDQAMYLKKFIEDNKYLNVDYDCKFVANLNAYTATTCVDCIPKIGLYSEEHNYFEFRVKDDKENLNPIDKNEYSIVDARISGNFNEKLKLVNRETGCSACVLHFPGKNFNYYNLYGKKIWGDEFKIVDQQPNHKLEGLKESIFYDILTKFKNNSLSNSSN